MKNINEDAAFSGFRLGMLVGALFALFNAPRIRIVQLLRNLTETGSGLSDKLHQAGNDAAKGLRDKLTSLTPSDPINDSIAEGKAAARRRRTELGLDGNNHDL